MKKFVFLMGFSFFILSCQNEIKFNNPGFQARKDNFFWTASDSKALLSTAGGTLTIMGLTDLETVTLTTTSTALQSYPLGTSDTKTAKYQYTNSGQSVIYTTGINKGNGEIVITDYSNGTVSGTFRFNAINSNSTLSTPDVVNYQYGKFYKIPVYPAP